jgi:AraC-like DNA-binding protein
MRIGIGMSRFGISIRTIRTCIIVMSMARSSRIVSSVAERQEHLERTGQVDLVEVVEHERPDPQVNGFWKHGAARCGFGSEETMRRSFVRLQGVSPSDYQRRFGG